MGARVRKKHPHQHRRRLGRKIRERVGLAVDAEAAEIRRGIAEVQFFRIGGQPAGDFAFRPGAPRLRGRLGGGGEAKPADQSGGEEEAAGALPGAEKKGRRIAAPRAGDQLMPANRPRT